MRRIPYDSGDEHCLKPYLWSTQSLQICEPVRSQVGVNIAGVISTHVKVVTRFTSRHSVLCKT